MIYFQYFIFMEKYNDNKYSNISNIILEIY